MSNNINNGLIIHRKNIKKEFLSELILKYINFCIICSGCKSYNTIINIVLNVIIVIWLKLFNN